MTCTSNSLTAVAASLGLPASSIEVLTNTLTANSGASAGIILCLFTFPLIYTRYSN